MGVVGAFISEDPVETERVVTIQFCYLLPEFADISNYRNLIDTVQVWGKQMQCSHCRVIDIGNNIQRLQDIYDELGYSPVRLTLMTKEIA